MFDKKLYIKHILTLYHPRWHLECRRRKTVRGTCSCGRHFGFTRKYHRRQHLLMICKLCWLRGHLWPEDVVTASFGPVGFDENDPDSHDRFYLKQCERCFCTKTVES